jgi:curli production assembly/transport component CsgF
MRKIWFINQKSSFGGDTFNYQWLASSAESQNKFKEPSSAKAQKTDLEVCGPIEFSIVKSNFKIIIHTVWLKGLSEELYFGSLSVEVYIPPQED